MSMGIEDAAFIVAGGPTPFALALARLLVDEGARVLLVGPELESLEPAVEALGDAALPCVADLRLRADAARVGGVAAALIGGVDGVVLPPVTPPAGDLLDVSGPELRASVSASLWGPLALLQGVVPMMEAGAVLFAMPLPAQSGAARLVRSLLDAFVDELTGTLGPAIRVHRVEPAPELAGDAARLLAPP